MVTFASLMTRARPTIVGGGQFRLKPGAWTDDTSMPLATSLVERGRLDRRNLIERFCDSADKGDYSHNGRCLDIGITVRSTLGRFRTPV